MEQPGYQSQEPYDHLGFAAKSTPSNNGVGPEPVNFLRQTPPKFHYDDEDEEDDQAGAAAATNGHNNQPEHHHAPMNGKHHSSRYEYDEDDEVECDLGPETNVDAVDDVPEDYGKLDQAMASPRVYPDEFLLNKSMSQREAECYGTAAAVEDNDKRPQHEVVHEGDNVGDSEESEDEWNYYRPEDKTGNKDPALVENPDLCEGEKELCSPKPNEDEDNNHLQGTIEDQLFEREHLTADEFSAAAAASAPVASAPADPEPDDEVTAEYDELHQNNKADNLEQPRIELKEADAEADSTVILEEELPFDKEQPELDSNHQFVPVQSEQLEENNRENQEENEEDMDVPLNPEAAEFVPVSPTSALAKELESFTSDLISGSPLKQSQRDLQNRAIPSEEEFKEEISSRPSDINDTTMSDFSNGDMTPNKSSSFIRGGFEDSKQATMLVFDESEVSSTKAEYGDDTVANFSTLSELQKTGTSNMDCSFTGSDRSGFDFSNSMTVSMTPSDFKQAFEQEVDLNQVHELNDEDLSSEVQNGICSQNSNDKVIVKEEYDVDEEDDLGKDKIDVDMENISFHQEQNIEVFSAVVDEKITDNENLFENMHNNKNSHEFENNDKLEDLSHAKSNPFASDYAPASENDIMNLADGLQKVQIDQAGEQQQVPDLFVHDVPATEEKMPEEVMQNPLDLNFGNPPEQKDAEMFLVSPVKDPEVMSSKFAEEENISEMNHKPVEQNEYFSKINHMDDFSSAPSHQVNLSESLQEFTGLEEELLSSKVNNISQDTQVLKENLVDELKDVEEVSPSPVLDEAKVDLTSVTNESSNILSNEIPVAQEPKDEKLSTNEALIIGAATAATAVAATAAAKGAKSASIASKTTKTTATKPSAKSSTLASTKTTTTATKKPAGTTTTLKTKSTTAAASKTATNVVSKTTTATKTTSAAKPASGVTTKTTSRPSTAPVATSKPKPLSSVTPKISSTTTEKKATTNGTAAAKSTTASKPASKSSTTSTTTKTGLVKTSTTTRMSSISNSTATAKPRPTSATASKPTTKPSSNVTSASNSTVTARPKTAPASTLNSVKSKVGSTTKSPMIDKQIKETANKQISSARAPATGVSKARQSLAPSASNSAAKRSPVTTKTRTSLAPPPKMSTANSAASPAKKTITNNLKPNLKNVTSKVNSKVTSTAKTTVTSSTVEVKPIQNGVCESNETVVTSNITTTTVTTNIEEDLPKKDISPIDQPTDNQLISAE